MVTPKILLPTVNWLVFEADQGVKPRRYVVQVAVEEIRVDVERDGGARVSEHALNDLDVRSRLHSKGRSSVAKVVGG